MLQVDRGQQHHHRAEHEADERPTGHAEVDEVGHDEHRRDRDDGHGPRSPRQNLAERAARTRGRHALAFGGGRLRRHGCCARLGHVQVGVGPVFQFEGCPAAVCALGGTVHVHGPLPPVIPMVAVQAPFCSTKVTFAV